MPEIRRWCLHVRPLRLPSQRTSATTKQPAATFSRLGRGQQREKTTDRQASCEAACNPQPPACTPSLHLPRSERTACPWPGAPRPGEGPPAGARTHLGAALDLLHRRLVAVKVGRRRLGRALGQLLAPRALGELGLNVCGGAQGRAGAGQGSGAGQGGEGGRGAGELCRRGRREGAGSATPEGWGRASDSRCCQLCVAARSQRLASAHWRHDCAGTPHGSSIHDRCCVSQGPSLLPLWAALAGAAGPTQASSPS